MRKALTLVALVALSACGGVSDQKESPEIECAPPTGKVCKFQGTCCVVSDPERWDSCVSWCVAPCALTDAGPWADVPEATYRCSTVEP